MVVSGSSSNGTDKTLHRGRNDGISINLGQYDCSDGESVDYEFGFAGEDQREEKADVTFDDEPTAATENGTVDGTTGRPDSGQLLQEMHARSSVGSRSRMSSRAPGGGSSGDDDTDSSSGDDSSDDSFSSRRRRRHSRKRRSKKRSDPSWNTFGQRGQYTHRKSKRQIEQERRKQHHVKGKSWWQYLFEPDNMRTNPDTHLHLPWTATRTGYSEKVLCHPIAVAIRFADAELFLSNFNRIPQQADLNQAQKGHAAFVKNFPTFRAGSSLSAYCYEIVNYSLQYGHYVPPPFTLTAEEVYGKLYPKLPAVYQDYARQTTSGALAEAFKNPKTKLITLESLAPVVVGTDGYQIYSDLVALSGQPQLDRYAQPPERPKQTVDQSLLDHVSNWEEYIYKMLMHGSWMSDRAFVEQLHQTSHHVTQTQFTDNLIQQMKLECRDINMPLPREYHPGAIRTTLTLLSRGRYDNMKLAGMSVRDLQRASRQTTAPEFDMRAISADRLKDIVCYECGEKGHMASAHRKGAGKRQPYDRRPPIADDGPDERKIREVALDIDIGQPADDDDAASEETLVADNTGDVDSVGDTPVPDDKPDFV